MPPILDDAFLRDLPGDFGPPREPRPVRGAAWSLAAPTPVADARLLVWVPEVGDLLGLSRPEPGSPWHEALAGNAPLPDRRPWAACYGGHQFGHWAGQLGDGRAMSLCEVIAGDARWEVQLKGAGPTPYSRRADGRAVLRSSIRELLCSEAMHHLGVPTTRALCLFQTGDGVVRDMFYDGRPSLEPGAIVTRVAPTFLRFGSFEWPTSQGDLPLLERLVDWTIGHHFPTLAPSPGHLAPTTAETRERFFIEVAQRTARMIAQWMGLGFVHGVMNTDNFSILGLTLDYGPYGWLDAYEPAFTPNTTDLPGRRYAYGRQPAVALWNLDRLADALSPLISPAAIDAGLEAFRAEVQSAWSALMARKLGLTHASLADRDALLADLFGWMARAETDWTLFFRALARVPIDDASDDARLAPLAEVWYPPPSAPDTEPGVPQPIRDDVIAWLHRFTALARATPDVATRAADMDAVNPWFIPRNYLVQQAIDRAQVGDISEIERLLEAARRPYEARPDAPDLHRRRPEWARHRPGCAALSCSS